MADNALSGVTDLLTKVLPQLTGSKQTQTESMQVDPQSNAVLQALLGSLTAKSTGTGGSDELLASLLDKAQLSTVLPAVGQQQQAGLYKGNTVADITARARAKAANDAMAVILQSQNQAGQSAAYLAASNQKANTTSKKTVATPGNPLLQALGIAGTGYGAAQKLGIIEGDPIAKLIKGLRGKKIDESAADILKTGVDSGTLTEGGDAVTTGTGLTDTAAATTAIQAGGTDTAAILAGDAGFFGAGAAELGGAFALADAPAAILAGDAGFFGSGAVAAAPAAELASGFGLEELATAAILKVICTEAVRQGLMDRDLYLTEAAINLNRLSKTTLTGYHKLATPVVLCMRKSPRVARFFARCAIRYSEQVTGVTNTPGFLIMYLLEPVCWLVGRFCKPTNLSVALYGTQSAKVEA